MENNKQLVKIGLITLFGLILLFRITIEIMRPDHPIDKWPDERPIYQVIEEYNLEEIWSQSNIFARFSHSCCPKMTAEGGNVFLDGIFDQPDGNTQILAFDGNDGALLWQSSDFSHSVTTLQASAVALYAGFDSNGPLRAYSLETGDILWSNTNPGDGAFPPRYTRRLRVADNIIYLETSNTDNLSFVQADTGEVLKMLNRPFTNENIQKAATELAQTLGISSLETRYFWRDAITQDATLLKLESGTLRAYDLQTDNVLWEIDSVICNVVATDSIVYFLGKGQKLMGVNSQTGEMIAFVQFERIETEDYTPSFQGSSTSCYVAVDKDNNLIYVFWGAGAQLFAFKLR